LKRNHRQSHSALNLNLQTSGRGIDESDGGASDADGVRRSRHGIHRQEAG
jgi:hypothetical protein